MTYQQPKAAPSGWNLCKTQRNSLDAPPLQEGCNPDAVTGEVMAALTGQDKDDGQT